MHACMHCSSILGPLMHLIYVPLVRPEFTPALRNLCKTIECTLQNQIFFDESVYDEDHRQASKFIPGFSLLEIPGAQLKIIGILEKEADLSSIDQDKASIPNFFYKNVLRKAIRNLSPHTRTRSNNLVMSSFVPRYYHIFPEDVPLLSKEINGIALPPNSSYRFFFLYYKYGQQQLITEHPLTLHNTGLDQVVVKPKKVICSSAHFAINFTHKDSCYSLFWKRINTYNFLRGRDTNKYEIGNITSKEPNLQPLLTAWPSDMREGVTLTYAQAYTPFTKPLDNTSPFHSHPFLLTILLGREYVRSNPLFRHLYECTEELNEYLKLREAIILQLTRATGRFEVVATSARLKELISCDFSILARHVLASSLLVQVNLSHAPLTLPSSGY